jgi:hypothetical protein
MTYKPQADLNHNQHIDPNHRYGCKDRPAQGGRWLPIPCGHSYRETDPGCQDCKWRSEN